MQPQQTVNSLRPNPMASFMDITLSGLKGYGAFT